MNTNGERRLTSLERRLARREPLTLPAAMRRRILAAVETSLATPDVARACDDMRIACSACVAMALTLVMLVLTLSLQPNRPEHVHPAILSLADRAAAVGIAIETGHPAFVAARRPHPTRSVAGDGTLRPMDMPRVLRGDL